MRWEKVRVDVRGWTLSQENLMRKYNKTNARVTRNNTDYCCYGLTSRDARCAALKLVNLILLTAVLKYSIKQFT